MVPLPSLITSATLSVFYWPATNDSSSYGWQEAAMLNSSGQVSEHRLQKTTTNHTWIQVTFDLSKYAGQTIGIQFLDHEDANGSSSYAYRYVDDVARTVHSALCFWLQRGERAFASHWLLQPMRGRCASAGRGAKRSLQRYW